jgi:teichuronic acid biosynthesis glycosyltransferase TuaH
VTAGAPSRPAPDVVFAFFRVSWSDSRARGGYFAQDRLATALVHRAEIPRVVIADSPRHPLAIALALARSEEVALPALPGRTHVRLLGPTRDDATSPGLLRAVYAAAGLTLGRRSRRAGLRDPVVLTTNPFLAAFGRLEWARTVTLLLTDDFAASAAHRRWHAGHRAAWEALRRRRIAVAAVSPAVLDPVAPTGPSLVVPNGVEAREWSSPGPAPEWFLSSPGPRLLYVGGLDDRIEADQLAAAAAANPGGTIWLVGPTFDEAYLRRLTAIEGVRAHGLVPRDVVAALVHGADACLVPHRRTELTAAMSPIKLYEYLAGGRSVAAIDLPPMRNVDERVFLAAGAADFGDAVRRALAAGPMSEAERLRFLQRNGWAARHDQLLALADRRA